ncbi:MAG: glycosyltransferase family 2 protein [Minisyncoccota bacterium]
MWIIIPAYNEGRVIRTVIDEIRLFGYQNIIVVDDGSTDDTEEIAKQISGVVVLKHLINRGKGAAVKTGIEAAKKLGASTVITLDGDGQHDPSDISAMLTLIHTGYDVVLGSRLKNTYGMPRYKILHNHIGNIFVWMLYGLWVTDSQSGFRAYSTKALRMIDTKTDRYEYDSEIIREIRYHKLTFAEVPIQVRYTAYSLGKKQKMNSWNGFKTLIKMILSS